VASVVDWTMWSSNRRRSVISASSASRHPSARSTVGAARKAAISVRETPARRSSPIRVATGIWDGW